MTSDTLIETFVSLSGRYDLEVETILAYLNAGQKYLDDVTTFKHSPGRYLVDLTIGQSFVSLPFEAKIIESIDLIQSPNRYQVDLIPLTDLKVLSNTLPSFLAQARPEFCSFANVRKMSETTVANPTTISIIDTDQAITNTSFIFNCPVDQAYLLDISGKFYSQEISEGSADSWWAAQYPFTLIHAGLMKLEVGTRNTEGMKDWLNAIMPVIKEIQDNVYEQESINITRMEG